MVKCNGTNETLILKLVLLIITHLFYHPFTQDELLKNAPNSTNRYKKKKKHYRSKV